MLIIGITLSVFGVGLLCWLIFTLAVYALPFFFGLTAGMTAFQSGLGILGACLVGAAVGALTLGIGQFAFALVKPVPLRVAIAAAFAIPAAIAGYHAVLGLSQIGVPSLFWQETFAWVGAIVIGGTAWVRMMVLAEPLPLRPGSVRTDEPVLTAATREDCAPPHRTMSPVIGRRGGAEEGARTNTATNRSAKTPTQRSSGAT